MSKDIKIFVNLKPNSKNTKVTKDSDNEFTVRVKQPPVNGGANKAMIDALSKYLGIAKSRIEIKSGHKSRNKVLVIR